MSRALKEAHHCKLPKDNIERALKKATETSDESYATGYYEVYGHGGVGVIVATLTDNSNRANMAIKSFARKSEVKMASSGSVMFNFDHKVGDYWGFLFLFLLVFSLIIYLLEFELYFYCHNHNHHHHHYPFSVISIAY